MLKKVLTLAILTAVAPSVWADSFNQNITAIFGTGNPNTGWTTDTGDGITLGLRAKDRSSGSTANVNGTYSFAAGFSSGTKSTWNWEFSINSGTALLPAFDYYIGIDLDPSAGINYTYINALTGYTDNAYGNGATLNGQGQTASPNDAAHAAALAAVSSVAQNSENMAFGPQFGNALLNGTYTYDLFAVSAGAGVDGRRLDETTITVLVGQGGARVPETTSTAALLGFGLVGLFALRKVKATA